MKHVDLVGLHADAATGTLLLLLREVDAPHRVLPISIGGTEAVAIAVAAAAAPPPRPLTHDLLLSLVVTLDANVDRVEVTELRDGAFHAELAVSGPTGPHRLDSRPSDAIALAVRVDAPLFVSEAVLDEAGAILTEEPDDEEIDAEVDAEVARFRSFLDRLDPAGFDTGIAGELPAGPSEQHGADSGPDPELDEPPEPPET